MRRLCYWGMRMPGGWLDLVGALKLGTILSSHLASYINLAWYISHGVYDMEVVVRFIHGLFFVTRDLL